MKISRECDRCFRVERVIKKNPRARNVNELHLPPKWLVSGELCLCDACVEKLRKDIDDGRT